MINKSLLMAILFVSICGILYSENGIKDNEILIGSSLVLDGPAKFLGVQTKIGYEAYIKKINDAGGIYDRKIKTIFYDDGYDPDKCAAATKKLLEEDKVFALSCYVGTPTTKIAMPSITAAKTPLIGCYTGGEVFRNPLQKYIINVRASYNMECAEIVNHFVKDLGLSKIAVFYQNDAYGMAGLQGTVKALKENNLTITAKATYERNTVEVEEAVNTLREAKPDAIVMIGAYAPCAEFIKKAKKSGIDAYYHNVSFVGPEKLAENLGKDGDGVIVTQVVPLYDGEHKDYQFIEWYKTDMKKYFPNETINSVSLEGYLNAVILVEGLKRAGKDLTRDKLVEAVESIQPGQLGTGVKISFSAADHQGSDKVFVTIIKNGKYEYVTDFKALKK